MRVCYVFMCLVVLALCSRTSNEQDNVSLTVEDFGMHQNETIKKFTWKTDKGFSVSVISYGAIVQSIKVPDKNGIISDVVLGFDDLDSYVNRNTPYFGSAVGRCANRIAGAKFEIDGVTYKLAANDGVNHIHGGINGFNKKHWVHTTDGNKVTLSSYSEDGEEGYPGDLVTNIIYEVKEDDSFHVRIQSSTTKKTIVNLTYHTYFNLAGHETGAEEMYNHEAAINADKVTEADSSSIPTGSFIKVGNTSYDLRTARRLGDILSQTPTLFDNNFCVSSYGNQDVNFVSRVTHPPSGRYMEVHSNQPGVQFYTSYNLPAPQEEALVGKDGVGYRRHGAFCLETQNYPDAIHHSNFPKVVLSPGEVYRHLVVYHFGVATDENAFIAV